MPSLLLLDHHQYVQSVKEHGLVDKVFGLEIVRSPVRHSAECYVLEQNARFHVAPVHRAGKNEFVLIIERVSFISFIVAPNLLDSYVKSVRVFAVCSAIHVNITNRLFRWLDQLEPSSLYRHHYQR